MNKKYKRDLTRKCSLFEIKYWYEGESKELEKWLGFGFFNTFFVSENEIVTLYYDVDEGDKFHEVLKEKLTEELFNEICDEFYELFEKKDSVKTKDEIFDLCSKAFPAAAIFDELSKYPELGNENMLRRLMRIRKSTESLFYDIEKKLNSLDLEDQKKDYIFFQGKLYFKSFENFIKEKGIEIVK